MGILAFALEVVVRVADIVGNAVQLADGGLADHVGVGIDGAVGAGDTLPRRHRPGILGGLRRTAAALFEAGVQADAPDLVRAGVAEVAVRIPA